jgi:CHAT domain-containing protein
MQFDRDTARLLALDDDQAASERLHALGLLTPDGFDKVLEVARAAIRDDPAVGARLAALVRVHAADAMVPLAVHRAEYLLAQSAAAGGDMILALSLIDDAHDGMVRAGHVAEALRTNLGRSQALNEMGRHEEALAACAAILESEPAGDSASIALHAAAHQNSGLCLELMGRFEEALDHYASATIGFEALGDRRAVAEVTYDRALVLQTLGQHTDALHAFQRAASAFDEQGFRSLHALAMAHTAEVQLHRGEYQECLESLATATAALDGISASVGEHTRSLVAARAYLALNLLPEAERTFDEVSRQLAGTDLVIDQARAEWGRGLVLARLGRGGQAIAALTDAAARYRQSGHAPWLAEVLVDTARVHRTLGDTIAAARIAGEAFDRALPGTPARASAELLLAELSGDPDRLGRAGIAIGKLDLSPLMAAAAHAHGRALLDAGRFQEARQVLTHAIRLVEALRGGLAHELVLTRFLDDKLSPFDDLLAALAATGATAGEMHSVAEQARSRTLNDIVIGLVARRDLASPDTSDDLRALYSELFAGDSTGDEERTGRLRQRIRDLEADRELAMLRTIQRPRTTTRGNRLPATALEPRTAAISYVRTGARISALVVIGSKVTAAVELCTIAEAAALADRLRRQWERFRIGTELVGRHVQQLNAATTHLLGQLYDALVRPLEGVIDPAAVDTLVIVPDSPLHDLPIHAFWTGSEWLLQRFEVRYVPSLGTLAHLASPRLGHAVVCGRGDALAPLVSAEVRSVASLLPGSITLVDDDATWEALAAALPDAAHIHLAGHALFRPDNPMYSALRLSGSWVTAGDLLRLDLRGATVVLSACDTARTELTRSAEVNGFVRGFLGAGASTVVASQWTADDVATTELMREFTAGLALGPAAAMRNAQLAMAERASHPYHWASWVVIGRSGAPS